MTDPNHDGGVFRDRGFWCAVVAALVIRAGLLAWAAGHGVPLVSTDTPTYTRPAHNFMTTGTFSQDVEPPHAIDTMRTPAYPLMLAAVWWATGTHSAVPVAVVQVLLSTAAVALVYAAGRRLAGPTAALVAALALALESLSAALPSYLLSDAAYQFALAVWAYLLVRFLQSRSWPLLVAVSVAAGLGLYVRPVGLLLPVALAAMVLAWRGPRLRRRLAQAAVAIAIPAAIVFPWSLRNHLGADTWEFTTIASRNMLRYRAAKVMSMAEGKDFYGEAPLALLAEAESRTPQDATAGERLRVQRAVAVEYMADHPWLTLKAHAWGAAVLILSPDRWSVPHLLGRDETGGILHGPGGWGTKLHRAWQRYHPVTLAYVIWAGLYTVALWVAGLLGWGRLWRRGHRAEAMALLLTLACLVVASAVPESEPRLRLPMVVPLALLAAGLATGAERPAACTAQGGNRE